MAGAASSTMGTVVAHTTSQEPSQCSTNAKVSRKGTLATAAVIADVRPDWTTLKTKCSYFLGMRSIAHRQPAGPIQSATARPISCGESS